MKKNLVAYFSCSGVTEKVAKKLANVTNADLYEIKPKTPYTDEDLNWQDKNSRSSIEMKDLSSRPEINGKIENIDDYQNIFIGFPIWWYIAPTIINTFLEQYDLRKKTIIPFATSGISEMGKTNENLKPSCPNSILKEGKRFPDSVSENELKIWSENIIK